MGLDLGYRVNEEHDGIWIDDPALMGVSESARADWQKDGSSIHLLPFAKNGQPTILKWRALNVDEARYVKRLFADDMASGFQVLLYECFALAVRFPDASETVDQSGVKASKVTKDRGGFHRLSVPFMNALELKYPDMINFFGGLIMTATWPNVTEKKASSPPSIETPSLGAADTKPDTVVLSAVERPAAA